MKMVAVSVVCENGDEDFIAKELISSQAVQNGLFCWGVFIRDLTEEEVKEVYKQME